ncbi:MAG: hypothetical protein PVI23_04380 [Maricaulaceae bacterium]|jgi:hypothetical protein
MSDQVQLLSPAGNYCVVQVDGRKFPGVVFQGDSIASLLSRLNAIEDRLRETGVSCEDDARAELDFVRDALDRVLQHYESFVAASGGKLPYPARQPLNLKL